MLNKLQTLWREQSPKDQIYLIVGTVIISLFLLWIGLCQPLMEWRDQQQQRLDNLTRTLDTVELLASQLQRQSQANPSVSSKNNLAEIVDTSLRDNNLRMKGFQPGRNGEVRLSLEDAAYKPLMQWLYDLEYQHDIQIQELNLAQTQTAGLLTVSLSISKP